MTTEPSATTEVFAGLPDSLVEDLLNKTDAMSAKLSESFSKISSNASEIRKKLENKIKIDSEIMTQHKFPTSCGIDGSYTSSKLLSTDIVGIVGTVIKCKYVKIANINSVPIIFINREGCRLKKIILFDQKYLPLLEG